MNVNLPLTDQEADEKLIEILKIYIIEKKMPIHIANEVLRYNIKDPISFNIIRCESFIKSYYETSV